MGNDNAAPAVSNDVIQLACLVARPQGHNAAAQTPNRKLTRYKFDTAMRHKHANFGRRKVQRLHAVGCLLPGDNESNLSPNFPCDREQLSVCERARARDDGEGLGVCSSAVDDRKCWRFCERRQGGGVVRRPQSCAQAQRGRGRRCAQSSQSAAAVHATLSTVPPACGQRVLGCCCPWRKSGGGGKAG